MDIPVIKDDTYDINVIDLNHRGQGFGRIDEFAVFMDGGIPGDKVKVKISTVKKNYAVGEIVSFIEYSEDRVNSRCPISNTCGGCQLQELSYHKQLEIKTNRVKNDIKRIGGLEDPIIHNTIGMNEPYRYRNKAQFPVGVSSDKVAVGFYKSGTHEIVDTNSCIIQHDTNDKVIKIIKDYMMKYKVKPYDEKTGKGILRHVLTKTAFRTRDIMIILITKGNKLANKEELIKTLRENIPNLKSIVQNINNKKTNVILGHKSITLYGEDKIVDYIGDLRFNISPESFFQVNPMQTEVLYNKALEFADLIGDEVVFDLYCGIGTISLFLAKKAKKVYGVEVVKQAIIDARDNARTNSIDNVEFYDGAAEEVFPRLYNKGIRADVIVLDPPRKGCEKSVLDTIADMKPKKVVYVSCNPSTLARDLKYLDERGYKTLEIQPVDMFPHTMHVECCVSLKEIK